MGDESMLLSEGGEFGEINMGGEILFAWEREGVGCWGVASEGGESSVWPGGMVEIGGGHAVVESKNYSLVNLLGEDVDPG